MYGRLYISIVALIVLLASASFAATCPDGFNLETNSSGQQWCRNPTCDAGENLYGSAIDQSLPVDTLPTKDMGGMPLPKGKDPDGKWVGWTIGAYQCPPDPIGLHPNPEWPCGFDYCPEQSGPPPGCPVNIRIGQ
jgi:hypothetical protein